MGKAETKKFLNGGRHHEEKSVRHHAHVRKVAPSRTLPPDEEAGEKIKIAVCEHLGFAASAAEAATDFCRKAEYISGVIGENEEARKIAGKILSEAGNMLAVAEEVADVYSKMEKGEINLDDAYFTSLKVENEATKYCDAARTVFEELKALQKRILAKGKAESVIGALTVLGVHRQVAERLCNADWDLAGPAVVAARKIAVAKDEEKLFYSDLAASMEKIFNEGGWSPEKIFFERKYIYDGGIPNSTLVIQDIEKEIGVDVFHDAGFHGVPGVGAVYHLRCMKMLTMILYLFYQPEYLWENSLVKVSGVDCAEAKAEA
jgi:hypothetical protein